MKSTEHLKTRGEDQSTPAELQGTVPQWDSTVESSHGHEIAVQVARMLGYHRHQLFIFHTER